MHHWALMLDQLPSGWQRLIARQQRIALPRGCDAAERVRRLRHALGHAATVRVTYDLLDPPLQHALQDLRTRRGGVRVESCHQQYGPVRALRQITADRRPQSITEHLCLLGWLLYRPATLRHPARYLVPPEVRRWLPRPLDLPLLGTAPPTPIPPALTTATLVLLTAAEQPLALCANTTLRQRSVRRVCERLPTDLVANPRQLLDLVVPLLVAMGCLSTHGGVAALTSTGQRWLTQPLRTRLASLRHAWMLQPTGDHCFTPLLPHPHGIDWPVLRQRLCHWATTIPPHQWVAAPYERLAQTWGPLANTRTHGFRFVDRAPWQPQRAAQIWATALAGPLHWLGYVTLRDPHQPTAALSHDPTLACLDAAIPA